MHVKIFLVFLYGVWVIVLTTSPVQGVGVVQKPLKNATCQRAPILNVDFFNFLEEWPKGLSLGLLLASSGISESGPPGELNRSNCSSSVVSTKGHRLTASHCIQACLRPYSNPISVAFQSSKLEVEQLRPDRVRGVECEIRDAITGNSGLYRVVATSSCLGLRALGEYEIEPSKRQCKGAPDFAILEPVVTSKNVKCFPIAKQKTRIGANLFTIGNATHTSRRRVRPSATDCGGQFCMSFGEQVQQSHCEIQEDVPEKQRSVPEFFQGHNLIQSTVDTVGGLSGGSLLNNNLELAGINMGGTLLEGAKVHFFGLNSININQFIQFGTRDSQFLKC